MLRTSLLLGGSFHFLVVFLSSFICPLVRPEKNFLFLGFFSTPGYGSNRCLLQHSCRWLSNQVNRCCLSFNSVDAFGFGFCRVGFVDSPNDLVIFFLINLIDQFIPLEALSRLLVTPNST